MMIILDSSDSDAKHGPDPLNIMIGIMGPTGTGKSSFIAQLTGDKSIEIGHGAESATTEIGHYNYFDKSGRCVTFVDSPGFDDSREGVTDTDVLKKIAAFLELEFKQDKKLSGIIYLHRIIDPKMGGVSLRNLRMFKNLCGKDALQNVVVVTTRWDDVQEKDRGTMEAREKELMETPGKFFEPLIAAGGRFLRHDNTAGSACRVMESILKNHPIPLQIQLEMRDGKKLEETAAGSELAAELKKLMDKHSREMKDLKEEMVVAIAERDLALKKELEAERTKMQKELAKWEEQKKALADDITAAREDAKKKQEEANRKLLEQSAEFDRKVKEAEKRAEEERMKLKVQMDNFTPLGRLLTFSEGSHYMILNCSTGRVLVLLSGYSPGRDLYLFEQPAHGSGGNPTFFSLKAQGDCGIALRSVNSGKWAGPNFCAHPTAYSYYFIPSEKKDWFFICPDTTFRQAFYDTQVRLAVAWDFQLGVKDLNANDPLQMWRVIPAY